MKTIRILTAALLLNVCTAFAQVPDAPELPPITAEDVRSIPSMSIAEIVAAADQLAGKVVKMTFRAQSGELQNGYGRLISAPGRKVEGLVSAVVPLAGVAWYRALPTRADGGTRTVIVRVIGVPKNPTATEAPQGVRTMALPRVEVLGRELKPSFKGPEFVW